MPSTSRIPPYPKPPTLEAAHAELEHARAIYAALRSSEHGVTLEVIHAAARGVVEIMRAAGELGCEGCAKHAAEADRVLKSCPCAACAAAVGEPVPDASDSPPLLRAISGSTADRIGAKRVRVILDPASVARIAPGWPADWTPGLCKKHHRQSLLACDPVEYRAATKAERRDTRCFVCLDGIGVADAVERFGLSEAETLRVLGMPEGRGVRPALRRYEAAMQPVSEAAMARAEAALAAGMPTQAPEAVQ